jgi:hypothetical protein
MSAVVKRIVLSTPAAVGQAAQFSALERCRAYSATATDSSSTAQASAATAQAASGVAVAARDAALAVVGGVKVTQNDASASVLDLAVGVAAPLNKAVLSPGGDETLRLGVDTLGGASASHAGTAGVAPAPQAGEQQKFLRGDATWQAPDDVWTLLPGLVTMLSPSQAAVAGNCAAMAQPGRALKPDRPAGTFGSVADAAYDAANSRTIITVEGFAVTGQCTQLWVGQDPRNAPSASSSGSDLYLAANYNCLMY